MSLIEKKLNGGIRTDEQSVAGSWGDVELGGVLRITCIMHSYAAMQRFVQLLPILLVLQILQYYEMTS